MAADRQIAFGSFRFDPRTGQLWRDGSEVKLTPRAAAVLHLLAERAQELVTKQDLFDRVWGGMAVGDDALTSCIQELRGALGDDARHPHYIETRHRRGYRLMVPATVDEQSGAATPSQVASPDPSRLVGRVAEFGELAHAFDQARSGRRQIVFVTGEPGIGKSSLADAFLEQVRTSQTVKIAHGQCLDHHGVGEPYLPLIEALTRLAGGARRSGGEGDSFGSGTELARANAVAVDSIGAQRIGGARPRDARAHDARIDACDRGDRFGRAAAAQARRYSLERHVDARLACPCGAPPGARPPHGDGDVPAGRRGGAKVGLGGLVTELALHGWCREIALASARSSGHRKLPAGSARQTTAARRSCARWRRCCWSGPAAIRCS